MPPLEELTFERRGGAMLARIKGEVDLSNAAAVKEQILDAVPNTTMALVVDLTETEYLDSSGIRLIFELAGRLESRGQKLDLVIPEESVVRRVLVLTEVQQAVPMSRSVEAVLQD
jgi:anti-anti-sigma factor